MRYWTIGRSIWSTALGSSSWHPLVCLLSHLVFGHQSMLATMVCQPPLYKANSHLLAVSQAHVSPSWWVGPPCYCSRLRPFCVDWISYVVCGAKGKVKLLGCLCKNTKKFKMVTGDIWRGMTLTHWSIIMWLYMHMSVHTLYWLPAMARHWPLSKAQILCPHRLTLLESSSLPPEQSSCPTVPRAWAALFLFLLCPSPHKPTFQLH